jgi:hypothetical protein
VIYNVENSPSRDLANLSLFHLVSHITRRIYKVENSLSTRRDLANLSFFILVSPIARVIYNMENSLSRD